MASHFYVAFSTWQEMSSLSGCFKAKFLPWDQFEFCLNYSLFKKSNSPLKWSIFSNVRMQMHRSQVLLSVSVANNLNKKVCAL